MTNRLYYGDNLEVLRQHVTSESIDLVYLGPPFNSNRAYNVLFRSTTLFPRRIRRRFRRSMILGTGRQ
jgi:16S rRNA G966 N2-methylase RsmD